MKKIIAMLMLLALVLTGCGSKTGADGKSAKEKYGDDTLKIFLPGEYMADNLVTDFEKEFGVKVIPEFFDSNEMMYTKVSAGDVYDVLIPSDYMIERLIKENALQKLDKSKLPNFANLSDSVLGLDYDANNDYAAPYFWGNVGIVYNTTTVDMADLENEGYGIFRDQKYKGCVYMYDSERDAFMMAMKNLGYSCNTNNEDEINAAFEWLKDVNVNMEPVYITDEVLDYMMNGNKDLSPAYSGDAVTILSENEEMGFYTPMEGTNIWCDAMVIPANANCPALAHEFINFVMSDKISMDNTVAVGYTTPNKNTFAEVTAEGGEYEGNDAYVPRTYAKDEIFHDDEFLRKKLTELMIKVKASK